MILRILVLTQVKYRQIDRYKLSQCAINCNSTLICGQVHFLLRNNALKTIIDIFSLRSV